MKIKKKTKYIIYAELSGERRYLFYDPVNGSVVATEDISLATVFPIKALCQGVIKAVDPVVKRDFPGLTLGVMDILS